MPPKRPRNLIQLNCSILGPDVGDIFQAAIKPSEPVGVLKESIKKVNKNTLEHVDARRLEIWKVSDLAQRTRYSCYVATTRLKLSDPLARDDIMTLRTITDGRKITNAQLLDALNEVSDYFSESPARRKLHLVVGVPHRGKH